MRTTFFRFQDTCSGSVFAVPLRLTWLALGRFHRTLAAACLAVDRARNEVSGQESSALRARYASGATTPEQEQHGDRVCALPTLRCEPCAPPLAHKRGLRRSSASAQIERCAALLAHRPFVRGLTARSRRPSTATSFGPAADTPYIFCARAKAGSRSGPPQLER
jgi:hypothetical protein